MKTPTIASAVIQAYTVISQGGTILYPTDTIWGIGCDACDTAAVDKIYQIKQRDPSKSLLVLASKDNITLQQSLSDEVKDLLFNSPTPTTVILPHAIAEALHLAPHLLASDGSIGIRIPRHEFCQQLLGMAAVPIVSTSANFSGQPSPSVYEEIDPLLKAKVDFCVPNLPEMEGCKQCSHIVKLLADGSIQTIR